MTPESTYFLQQLETSIDGVLFVTEGDYPLRLFIWSVKEDGEFRSSNFLQKQGYLEPIKSADFFGLDEYLDGYKNWGKSILNSSKHMAEKKDKVLRYRQRVDRFLNFLSSKGLELEAYRIVRYDLPVYDDIGECVIDHRLGSETYESSRLLIGKDRENIWIAISSLEDVFKDIEHETNQKFINPGLQQIPCSVEDLFQSIREASGNLVLIRRNCYDAYDETKRLILEVANSKEAVIDRVLHSNGFIRTCEFNGLSLEGEGMSIDCPEGLSEDGYSHRKFVPIAQLMKSYLKNLRTIFVGTHSVFDVYFVGQDSEGNWLGLSTLAVWTG